MQCGYNLTTGGNKNSVFSEASKQKKRETLAKKSEEEKAESVRKQLETKSKYTEEEKIKTKEKRKASMRKTLDAKSKEEKEQWQKKAHDARWKKPQDEIKAINEKIGNSNTKYGKVIQLTKNMDFVAEYSNSSYASKITGVSCKGILNCCKKINNHAGGFLWMFENDYLLMSQDDIKKKQKEMSGKRIIQMTKDNVFIKEYEDSREAYKSTKINQAHIIGCCKNKRLSAGGFVWVFAEEYYKKIK